jgi:hypothetical protein
MKPLSKHSRWSEMDALYYVHKMGNCWFHFWRMEILTQYSWKHYKTHSTHHCIYYTQTYKMRFQICLQRELALHFTVYLLTSTSTDANRAVMQWCIIPNHICNLESFGKIGRLPSLSNHKKISKTIFTCPYCTHCDILPTHHCAYLSEILWHITARLLSFTTSVSPYTPSPYDHIFLMQTLNVH